MEVNCDISVGDTANIAQECRPHRRRGTHTDNPPTAPTHSILRIVRGEIDNES